MFVSETPPAGPVSLFIRVAVIVGMLAAMRPRSELAREISSAKLTSLIIDPCGLPRGQDELADEALLIVMRADDVLVTDGRPIAHDELDALFRGAVTHGRDTKLIISVGRAVSHRAVVRVVELAKAAGLKRLLLGTVAETR